MLLLFHAFVFMITFLGVFGTVSFICTLQGMKNVVLCKFIMVYMGVAKQHIFYIELAMRQVIENKFLPIKIRG